MKTRFLRTALMALSGLMVVPFCPAQGDAPELTVEMFIDADPGFGKGKKFVTTQADNELTMSLADVKPGAHIVSVRVCDSLGVWSPTVTNPLYISDEQLYAALEYFVDTDPGQGRGVAVAGAGSRTVSFAVATDDLDLGAHTLGVRVQGIEGKWTDVMTRSFIVTPPNIQADNVIEYFFDKDPGYGNGIQLAAAVGSNVYFVPTETLSPGAHLISVRCRDKEDQWSATVTNPLYVAESVDVVSAEYFVDRDPGEGNGTAVALSADGNASFAVPTAGLSIGEHRLVLRGMTATGTAVTIFEAPFKVDDGGGVGSVTWTMDIDVYRSGSLLTVASRNCLPGSVVEIFTVNGICIKHESLGDGTGTVTAETAGQPGPFIVIVTDPEGRRYVRRTL